MPFLAPLIPALLSIVPEAVTALGTVATGAAGALGGLGAAGGLSGLIGEAAALPGEIGGILAPGLFGVGSALGLPVELAGPLANFLSPELLGAGIGYGVGGTKGLEEGLLGGATLGGGLPAFGQLAGNALGDLGAPGLGDAIAGATGPGGLASTALKFASPLLGAAVASQPSTAPSRTETPAPTAPPVGAQAPGGPSGLTLAGNTAPQVGPWLSNFWNPGGGTGSTGNTPMVGSAAPATSGVPSATNQQQLTSP